MLMASLSLTILVTSIIHIRAEYKGPQVQKYLFKPLTTGLIILLAILANAEVASPYKPLIIIGLLFSLSGDIFLMLPSDRFIAGLISFLIAHLLYISAFVIDAGFASALWAIPFFAYGLAIYSLLAPHVGRMKVPVIVYMLVISTMAWQAAGRWHGGSGGQMNGQTQTLLAFAGAILFVISDSVLALNRFRKPFRIARAATMSTYYAAQWLIALSIGPM